MVKLTMNCVASNMTCAPGDVAKVAVPPLPNQLNALTERIGMCAERLNRLSLFLTDTPINSDAISDKCVSSSIAYAVCMLDAFCDKLDYINEYCR